MRLLVVTDQWSPDVVGGSARVAAGTARSLASRGHEVVVIAPRQAGLPALEQEDRLVVHRRARRGLVPQTFADVEETYRLAHTLKGSFDVLVAHQATNAVGLLAARLPAPRVLVFHASVPLEQRLRRQRLSPPRRAATLALHPSFVLLERLAVRRASLVLTLSEFSRKLLLNAHPQVADRSVLVSGGVDADAFHPASPSDRAAVRARWRASVGIPFLLTVRRLEPRMGLEELLYAAKLLQDAGMRFQLAVAGDGALAATLRQLVRSLGLADSVRFLGRVSDEVLHELYGAADLFVLPTLAYEGFGISTVEALASGCPVVGTPVGATPELLRPLEPGLVARRAAAPEIADAIRWGLEHLDDRLRERCAEYARGRFGWEHVIRGWEAALTRARDEHGRQGAEARRE